MSDVSIFSKKTGISDKVFMLSGIFDRVQIYNIFSGMQCFKKVVRTYEAYSNMNKSFYLEIIVIIEKPKPTARKMVLKKILIYKKFLLY